MLKLYVNKFLGENIEETYCTALGTIAQKYAFVKRIGKLHVS